MLEASGKAVPKTGSEVVVSAVVKKMKGKKRKCGAVRLCWAMSLLNKV
jgi:hypothetical protein